MIMRKINSIDFYHSAKRSLLFVLCSLFLALFSCREDPKIPSTEQEQAGTAEQTSIQGLYLLNEGNMGSNKATLDYYDYSQALYMRNIYAQANPNVPMELGDVGNDLQIYGSRLYAVINCSNKVEVMDAKTGRRIGQVDIPNCRYIRFHGPYAYVTSYAGPVQINPDYEQLGYVARFDTASLQIDATCIVGFQPDELEIVGNTLFVANSGGYMVPNYEHTVSVIDLNTFTETERIDVAINLHRIRADRYGQLWITSRGDYYDIQPRLFCVDANSRNVVSELEVAVSDLDIVGDSLYFCADTWSNFSQASTVGYGIVNVRTRQLVSTGFIKDGTESMISKPYGLKVNPVTRDIYVTDAKDYVTPGKLYCYSPEGRLKWNVRTGDIPAHMAFYGANIVDPSDTTPSSSSNPYIAHVFDYSPAPGQFVNELPEYEEGDDANMMRLKAEEAIANNNQQMITLGGWGGSVTFGFDHMVKNVPGEYDFIVQGNAFYSGGATEERPGGSCEPGIVMVSYDANGNGKPDDEWFELAGSEYHNPATKHGYSVTYFRPEPGHTPTPSVLNPALTDTTYIRWTDNLGGTGYMNELTYHNQPYYPEWIAEPSLTFTGSRLPDNYEDTSGEGTYYVLYAYPWGYADNQPNNNEKARLKIDWAVRADGSPANLPGIHFVKVYTAVHQQCGWIGETSTEILGATDLHMTNDNVNANNN